MPKVSIIVPNYNHERFLLERLESIFNQTFQDYEVILLDDCSTDNSKEILERYSKNPKVSHFVVNKRNSGSTLCQWIKGFDLAKGDYIWIAESDDCCDTRFLEIVMSNFVESASICYAHSIIIDAKGGKIGLYLEGYELYNNSFCRSGISLINEYMGYMNIVPNASAVVFKKKYLTTEIKRNLNTFIYSGDWYLWITLFQQGDCVFIADPLNYFRRHIDMSVHVKSFQNIIEALKINVYLKKNDFRYSKHWPAYWADRANYSFKILFTKKFFQIYKGMLHLFKFPLFKTMKYIIHYKKTGRKAL